MPHLPSGDKDEEVSLEIRAKKRVAIEFTTDGTPILTDISIFGDLLCAIGGKM